MDRGIGNKITSRLAAILALLVGLTASDADAGPYRRGEYITITGQVRTLEGAPVGDVTVLFEASRRTFRLSKAFKSKKDREKTDALQVPTETDAQGNYRFEWRWDPYFNNFELAVALPTGSSASQGFEIFHRTDFTDRIEKGSPVEVNLEVEDTAELTWLQRFVSDLASDDEHRIYNEMGRPDRIDTDERSTGTEISWWYFEHGKVYRFQGGELSQVTHFDPIPSVEP